MDAQREYLTPHQRRMVTQTVVAKITRLLKCRSLWCKMIDKRTVVGTADGVRLW